MTDKLPAPVAKCDCLNDCGDDPRVKDGKCPPCANYKPYQPPLYTEAQMLAMHEQGRLAGLGEAAEACDDVEEPRYYGYENPNTFSDGKAACMSAIRSLAAASIGAKMGEE